MGFRDISKSINKILKARRIPSTLSRKAIDIKHEYSLHRAISYYSNPNRTLHSEAMWHEFILDDFDPYRHFFMIRHRCKPSRFNSYLHE